MKKLFILFFSVIAVCFLSNDALAQKSAKKAESFQANKYINANGNSAVKIHQPNNIEVRNALLARRDAVNASTTLTATEKQALINQINAKLAELG